MKNDSVEKLMDSYDSLDPTWRDFWKLSLFSKNGKQIYQFFMHDNFSLWWGFKEEFFRLGQSNTGSYKRKEVAKDLIDRYLRKRKQNNDSLDVAMINSAVGRSDMNYFGNIPSILESKGLKPMEFLVYYPPLDRMLPYLSSKPRKDSAFLYEFETDNISSIRDNAKKRFSSIYDSVSGTDMEEFYKKYFDEKQANFFRIFLKNCCEFYYPRAVWHYELYKEMIRKTRPKLLVNFAICSLYVYPGIAAAKNTGIPVVYVQPGAIDREFYHPDNFLAKNSVDGGMLLPDRYFVFDVSDRNGYAFSNIDKESIAVAGSPRFDCYVDYANPSREFIQKLKKKYHLPDGKKFAIWTPHVAAPHYKGEDEDGKTLAILLEFLGNHPEYHLIVKLHPDEDIRQKLKIYPRLSDKRISIFGRDSNLDELLVLAYFTIVSVSTTALQSILINTPVVLCTVVYPDPQPGLRKDGFDLTFSGYDELEGDLKILDSTEYKTRFAELREKFVGKSYPYLGSSSKVIAQELIKMLKK